jgi:hypothetical protein
MVAELGSVTEMGMRVTNFFRLNKSQAELDFIDVDVTRDTRLFIDPYAIEIRDDPFSERLKTHIVSFFQTLIEAIKSNDQRLLQSLTSHLSEPEETFLGMSKGTPAGRGVGRGQANQIIAALRSSRAVQTGLLTDLAETELFIEGISSDKLSDLTTNLIRGPLNEYTANQCALLGMETRRVAMPAAWNPEKLRWEGSYADIPIVSGKKVLLVPKSIVRMKLSLDSQEFYNNHILEFLQAEELSSNGSLVRMIKNGTEPRVYKKDLKEQHPFSKKFLADFVRQHPQIIETYKKIKGADGPLSAKQMEKDFNESVFALSLIDDLRKIPAGYDNASRYQSFMTGILTFLFYPHLTSPKMEQPQNEGRKRIDIHFVNSSRDGFFYRMRTWPMTKALYAIFECKNYSKDITNPEIDQLAGRFGQQRGNLGFITCRDLDNAGLALKRCRDVANEGKGLVLILTDENVRYLLQAVADRKRSLINSFLEFEASKRLN